MKNIKYTTLLTLLIVTFSNCKNKSTVRNKNQETHEQSKIMVSKAQFEKNNMKLGVLTMHAFQKDIKTTGVIDIPPQNKAEITSYYAGNVKKINLLIGDKVKKGQALVTLSNPKFVDIQQEYLEKSKQLHFLKIEYERQKILFNENIISQKKYFKSQLAYEITKAVYNGLRKKLQMLNINISSVEQGFISSSVTLYSPITGSVTKVNVSKGSYVLPQDIILEIINTSHIHIELIAYEKDVLKIKKDQKILFKIPEASDTIYQAEVHLVGVSIDKKMRTVKIHGHLHDEKKHNFAVGMFVDAEIIISSKEALALPNEAISEEKVVLILKQQENNQYYFKAVTVKTGKEYKGFTEILSKNIQAADRILVKGGYALVGGEEGDGYDN